MLVLTELKEYLSSNVPMTTPEMQNAPLPGHSISLGCFYTVNHSLLQMQFHGASSVAQIVMSHKSTFAALCFHSCSLARGTAGKQNRPIAASSGYLQGGELIIN